MANTIGQLLVELGVNTAAFQGGLDKATYMAKQFGTELKASFSQLSGSVKELGASFGGLGGNITSALSGVMNVVEPLAGSLATAGGAAAGITAAFAATGIAALGIAVHFSETAARADELSQATGLSVEAISSLGNIASTKGISMDSMARALERMDRSALKAAQSGPNAASAYKDLGIAVTDAEGHMRSAEDLFNSVAEKFATMPDGPKKTAEAIKIFGRTGAEMIPLLNEGGAKLAELEGHFAALNAVVDEGTAKASDKLKENMTLMGAAFTGIENQLTKDLVPAINVVAEEFISFFEENQDGIKKFADIMAESGKVMLNVFQGLGALIEAVYDIIKGSVTAVWDIVQPFVTMLVDSFKWLYDQVKPVIEFIGDKLEWLGGELGKVGTYLGTILGKGGEFGATLLKAASDFKKGWTDAIGDVSSAMTKMQGVWSASAPKATKRPTGNDDANENQNLDFVDKAVSAAETAANKMEDLAKAIGEVGAAQIQANAAAIAAEEVSKLQNEEMQKQGKLTEEFKAKLAEAIPKLQEAALWQETFKAALSADKEFKSFSDKMREHIASLQGAASSQTGLQAEYEKTSSTLVPLKKHLDDLADEYNKLAATPGADPKKVGDLKDALSKLNAEYQMNVDLVKKENEAYQQSKVRDELLKINQQTDALRIENSALLSGNPYGKMDADLDKFIKDMELAPEQAKKLQDALAAQKQSMAQNDALKTAQGLGYDPARITQLKAERDALASLNLPAAEYERTLTQINADIADQAAKTGGFFDGVKAGFADFSKDTESWGQTMQKVVGEGLKGFTDDFAQMVATGKASWGDLVNSMEQMLLKSAIQQILNSLFKSIGNALSGSSNGALSGLGSIFGGGHAMGGDVTPGRAYLVGEKGPELFSPGTSGSIIPNGQFGGGGGGNITVVQNIAAQDVDSFKRSQSQIQSSAYKAAAQKQSRMNQ